MHISEMDAIQYLHISEAQGSRSSQNVSHNDSCCLANILIWVIVAVFLCILVFCNMLYCSDIS